MSVDSLALRSTCRPTDARAARRTSAMKHHTIAPATCDHSAAPSDTLSALAKMPSVQISSNGVHAVAGWSSATQAGKRRRVEQPTTLRAASAGRAPTKRRCCRHSAIAAIVTPRHTLFVAPSSAPARAVYGALRAREIDGARTQFVRLPTRPTLADGISRSSLSRLSRIPHGIRVLPSRTTSRTLGSRVTE